MTKGKIQIKTWIINGHKTLPLMQMIKMTTWKEINQVVLIQHSSLKRTSYTTSKEMKLFYMKTNNTTLMLKKFMEQTSEFL